jgi:hypothetical protein
MKYFWSNTIWYVLLGILTAIELIYIFRKAKRRKFTLAFYITITGLALTIEVILFFIFSAYDYYPKIILTSFYNDELSGNLFSQSSVAATATLIAVYNLKNRWILVLAGLYGIIETLFLALGVYSHNWYKTWITVFGLIVLFNIIKKLYIKTQDSPNRLLHYMNIFFSIITLDVITLIWGFMLSGYVNYNKSFGNNPLSSPYLIGNIYSALISISLMAAYFLKLKLHLKAIVVFFLYSLTYIGYKLNIIYFKNEVWFLIFSTTYIFCVYYSIVLMDHLYKSDIRKVV